MEKYSRYIDTEGRTCVIIERWCDVVTPEENILEDLPGQRSGSHIIIPTRIKLLCVETETAAEMSWGKMERLIANKKLNPITKQ